MSDAKYDPELIDALAKFDALPMPARGAPLDRHLKARFAIAKAAEASRREVDRVKSLNAELGTTVAELRAEIGELRQSIAGLLRRPP